MSTKIIVGNWKMNKREIETRSFMFNLIPLVKESKNEIVICVPFTDLKAAIEMTNGTNIKIGAQNMHYKEEGAYTGEISGKMLYEMGVSHVIIGHSERRKYFAETDEVVNLKLKAAISNDLIPILCIGETFEERADGNQYNVIKKQIELDLEGISVEEVKNIIIAYEPIWAIGSGLTPIVEEIQEVTSYIIEVIGDIYGLDVSVVTFVLYGGSVQDCNSKEILDTENVDGGLIGGASLNVKEFAKICNKNYELNFETNNGKHIIC